MADLTRTVDVVLNGENHLSRKFRVATTSARKFAGVLGTGGTAAGAAGTVAGGAAAATAALAALGGYASGKLAQGLAEAYGEFAQFETSLKDLEKVLGEQPEKMERAKQAAQDMAVKYGVASEKIVDSMANWVQAGYSIDEAMTLAEDTIAATYASELNMQDATTTLTQILKGFGVEVDNARSKLDAINAISNNYAASVSQLSEGLGRAAPVAKAMGFSMEELASVMTPAIEKFQDGRRVGTAYKTMLTKLQSDTSRVTEALDTLGVKQKDANGQFKSGKEIFYEVGEAFQELDKTQKAHIATQIAGREHAAKLLATFNSWDQASQVYETAMDSAGSVTEEVKNRLEAASTQMDRFQAAGKVLAQVIGGQVAESFTEVIGSATDLVGALQEAIESGGASEFFERINEMAEELAEYLDDVAEAMPEAFEEVDFDSLADAVQGVADAFASWFGNLDLTKPDELAQAIQKVINGISKLINVFELLVRATDDIAGFSTDVIGVFQGIAREVRDTGSAYEGMIKTLTALVALLQGVMEVSAKVPGILPDIRQKDIDKVEALGVKLQKIDMALDKAQKTGKGFNETMKDSGEAAKEGKKETDDMADSVGKVGDEAQKSKDKVNSWDKALKQLEKGGKHYVELGAKTDEESAKEAGQKAEEAANKEAGEVKIKAEAEVEKKQIEKEMTKIETSAESTQKALEMKADVQTQEAENQMERYKSSIESVTSSLNTSTKALGNLFSEWSGDASFRKKWAIRDAIEQQMDIQEKQAENQDKLIDKQLRLMEKKMQAMEQGEGLLKIDAEGLEPALETVLWEIVQKVQIRASEEAQSFLLGLPSS